MERVLRRISISCAAVIMTAAVLIVVGWQFRIPALRGAAFGTFVAPNTALCFLLCGLSIISQLSRPRWLVRLGMAIGLFVTCFALATLVEYAYSVDLHIDRIFMWHRLGDWRLVNPGRFAMNTAIAFAFAGASLYSLRRRTRIPLSETFGLLTFGVSYLGLIGYLYSAPALYNSIMALPTIFLFGLLGIALMCAASRKVLVAIVASPYAGAIASGRMVLALLLLLPFFGLARVYAPRLQLIPYQVGAALVVVFAVAFFTALALHTGAVLNRVDKRRRDSEGALVKSEKLAAAGRVAATVAHEINNPLAAVGNIIYLLRNVQVGDEERRMYLEQADRELARVAAIARRTLGVYRENTRAADVSVCALLDNVLHLHHKKLRQKSIAVRKTADSNPLVFAKEGEIRQALDNIIANAIDAIPYSDGILEIVVTPGSETVSVEVRDNGHGIESGDLERIFEPFFTTKKDSGTGLGLWLARELVQKNNGTIEVVSSTRPEDQGTAVRLVLPAAVSVPEPAAKSSAMDAR